LINQKINNVLNGCKIDVSSFIVFRKSPMILGHNMVTYNQGLNEDGNLMDCRPAYDRLNRLSQRQIDLTPRGPLLDHGVGFDFDSY